MNYIRFMYCIIQSTDIVVGKHIKSKMDSLKFSHCQFANEHPLNMININSKVV